ncbi:60S ribosomal protein L9 [Heterostelium album PN500]|uniref:60S ribosomal protein L9 n=1 Tax=Heterostelium pallidum (strain ATCC 26659 / Pp 5 / PN500) TaxID=670386 RepID=D3BMQ1_HETP5|nr:60S ribosomal protein L9 [Heterostelium album PN500]EFA77263.1 60S ribosomal protein L9 [Heterostelium album PN500]|eukprot:XP_020429392.1 60S ribosomal protein L9 [Heterostelium album PN500]
MIENLIVVVVSSISNKPLMKVIKSSKTVDIPAGVTVAVKGRSVKVTGPRGTLKRDFNHMSVDINLHKKTVLIDLWFGTRDQIAAISTVASHIENMITGVTKGFEYKMRFVYAHFPINVAITDAGKVVEIRNFFGEKIVRRIPLLEGVTCTRTEKVKDEIVLVGNDLEKLSQSCANIQLRSVIKYKDVRKFLDGIYSVHSYRHSLQH